MLFDIVTLKDDATAGAVTQAILADHPAAQVTVQLGNRRVRVEGLITEQQVLDSLQRAGHFATKAPPHSGEGSTCCGGCGGWSGGKAPPRAGLMAGVRTVACGAECPRTAALPATWPGFEQAFHTRAFQPPRAATASRALK